MLGRFRKIQNRFRKQPVRLYMQSHYPFSPLLSCVHATCGCRVQNYIWISHLARVVYIQIPKCGSTSLTRALKLPPMKYSTEITDEYFLFSYFLRLRNYEDRFDNEIPQLVPIRYVQTKAISLVPSRADRLIARTLRKIDQGILYSEPAGEFRFCHYFGNLMNLQEKYPDYDYICFVRDPLSRFMSGLNMFYGDPTDRAKRKYSRIVYSSLMGPGKRSIGDIIDDIFRRPNHHFNPLVDFIDKKADRSRIQFIKADCVNDWLLKKFNLRNANRFNESKSSSSLYDKSDISDDDMHRITSFSAEDQRLYDQSHAVD